MPEVRANDIASNQIPHFRFSSSCSLRQKTFPVAVLGSASTNSTTRGTLKAAMCSRAQATIVLGSRRAARRGLEHHHRLHGLAAVRVARADDAGLLDVGMRVQHRLDLGRPDLEARGVDHALEAVGDEEVALLVVVAEVAGAEELLAVVLDERLARSPLGCFQ